MKSTYHETSHLWQPWCDAFNELPREVRHICCALSIKNQLQALHSERERLKAAYRKSLASIAAHEKNLVSELRREFGAPPSRDGDVHD